MFLPFKVGHRLLCMCVCVCVCVRARAKSHRWQYSRKYPERVTACNLQFLIYHRLNVNLYVEGCGHLTDAYAIVSSEAARVGGNLVFVAAGRGLLSHVLANK